MLGQKRLPKIYWWLLLMLLCIATITLVNLVPHHILGPEPPVEPERGPLFTRAQDPLAERVVFEHPAEGVALFPVELEATRRTSLLERGERRACMLVAHWSWRSETNTELRYNLRHAQLDCGRLGQIAMLRGYDGQLRPSRSYRADGVAMELIAPLRLRNGGSCVVRPETRSGECTGDRRYRGVKLTIAARSLPVYGIERTPALPVGTPRPPIERPIHMVAEPQAREGRIPRNVRLALRQGCELWVRPATGGRMNCRISLRCGGEWLYGAEDTGFAQCTRDESGFPAAARDTERLRDDGDPLMTLDFTERRISITETRWSVEFRLMPSPRCLQSEGIDGVVYDDILAGGSLTWSGEEGYWIPPSRGPGVFMRVERDCESGRVWLESRDRRQLFELEFGWGFGTVGGVRRLEGNASPWLGFVR